MIYPGGLSLYAALNPQTGEVIGQTAARHTSREFVAFLEEVIGTPTVQLHFTPTYSSRLNQLEKILGHGQFFSSMLAFLAEADHAVAIPARQVHLRKRCVRGQKRMFAGSHEQEVVARP